MRMQVDDTNEIFFCEKDVELPTPFIIVSNFFEDQPVEHDNRCRRCGEQTIVFRTDFEIDGMIIPTKVVIEGNGDSSKVSVSLAYHRRSFDFSDVATAKEHLAAFLTGLLEWLESLEHFEEPPPKTVLKKNLPIKDNVKSIFDSNGEKDI